MRFIPLGESALTIEFGNEISLDLNSRAIALATHFNEHPFPGLVETVPAYASVTLFFDPRTVMLAFPDSKTAFETVRALAEAAARSVIEAETGNLRIVEIPIEISEETSPDLDTVARHAGMDPADVIDIFLARTYRVYMLGFLPGFAYMGVVDDRIAAPRLSTARTQVPQGSVGIAGKQTGIYPLDSPGGWNIIGRTDQRIFYPAADPPCILKPGDEVSFNKIT